MKKPKQMVSFVLSGRIKKIYFTCFILLVLCNCKYSVAQNNLVPNYSFEILDTCPWTYAQIQLAQPWFQPNYPQTSTGSTDIWNSCDNGGLSTPSNNAGFQYPRTGEGYAGFSAMRWPNDTLWKEYLEVHLLDTLENQKKYCVFFHVSLAENMCNLPTSAIGAYFSNDSLVDYTMQYETIHVTPQIQNPYSNIISDTVNWVCISGILTGNGGEQFITIGNFWDPPNVNYLCIDSPCFGAYYFIDDVSVVELPELDAGNSDTICRGDSILLAGYISEQWPGMQYLWQPQNGINNPNALQTYASPDSTTTYYLSVSCATCDVPCLDSIIDSVTIFVIQPSLAIDAGQDTIIALGDSVQLGSPSQVGLTYQWQPATGLDNPYIAQPWASPILTTTYVLTSTLNENGCDFILQDSVTVDISVGINEFMFNGFDLLYPNPANDYINYCCLKNSTDVAVFEIYDILGKLKKVISIYNYDNILKIDVRDFAVGVYYYNLKINEETKANGKFCIIR